MSTTMLNERFRTLWTSCLPIGATRTGRPGEPIFDALLSRYTDVGRCYSSWMHLEHCLAEFDRAANQMDYPEAVELALWFHNVGHAPEADNDCPLGLELFQEWGVNRFPATLAEKVQRLIQITNHRQLPGEGDESYIVDIDLSSLAVHWTNFYLDSLKVRNESHSVSSIHRDASYVQFLKNLLDRPRIFHTYFFYERYETSARNNIRRLLAAENEKGASCESTESMN
jgi:predicted metal-dependent HD superfamily phosphohydrolase